MDIYDLENQENIHNNMKRSSRERKEVYRSLLNKIEKIDESEDVSKDAVKEIGAVLREANVIDSECKIDDKVKHADETFLDCLVISSASTVLKKCIDAVDVFTSTYNPSEFANNIVKRIKNEDSDEIRPQDLLKLLDDARSVIPKVPEYTYVYGTYDFDLLPQPKPRKERIIQAKEKLQKKEPIKVTNMQKDEQSIEEIVKVLFNVLSKKYKEHNNQPISYYDYIINTEDFANTIENIFYFSFLVRDGKARIDLNSKGDPIIEPVTDDMLQSFRREGGVNAQIITQINMDQWQNFKKPGYIQQYQKNGARNR